MEKELDRSREIIICFIYTINIEGETTMKVLKPLQMQAYEYMKGKILNNEFTPGEIYSETKIATEIGISRTPFRDAIQRLVQEGYIDIIPSKGFMLHEMEVRDIVETFQIRTAIEGYCAILAAKEAKSEKAKTLFRELDKLMDALDKFAEEDNISQFVEYDNQFHLKLVAYAGNSVFDEMFGMYIHRIRNMASSSLMHPGRVAETLKEHKDIVKAMKSGDIAEVNNAIAAHMERPKEIMLGSYK